MIEDIYVFDRILPAYAALPATIVCGKYPQGYKKVFHNTY